MRGRVIAAKRKRERMLAWEEGRRAYGVTVRRGDEYLSARWSTVRCACYIRVVREGGELARNSTRCRRTSWRRPACQVIQNAKLATSENAALTSRRRGTAPTIPRVASAVEEYARMLANGIYSNAYGRLLAGGTPDVQRQPVVHTRTAAGMNTRCRQSQR